MISQVSRLRRPRHPRGGAEDAAHRAADLRRETDTDRARLVQRDQDRLDRQAVRSAEQQLLKPVDRRGHRSLELQPRQRASDRLTQSPGHLKIASPDRWVMNAPSHDRGHQAADRRLCGAEARASAMKQAGARSRGSNTQRQRYIEEFGIRLLRFMNVEVYDNLDGVVEAIARALGLDEEPPCIPPS